MVLQNWLNGLYELFFCYEKIDKTVFYSILSYNQCTFKSNAPKLMEIISLPPILEEYLSNKKRYFVVKSKHANPRWIGDFFIVVILFLIVAVFGSGTLLPVLMWQTIDITVNNVPTTAWPWNLKPLLIPWIVIGTFFLAGIYQLVRSIKNYIKPWKYFVWTEKGIVIYDDRLEELKKVDRSNITNTIAVSGKWFYKNLTIMLTTGQMKTTKNDREYWVSDTIFIWWTDQAPIIIDICEQYAKGWNSEEE